MLRRNVGLALILGGVVAVAVALFVLVAIDTTVVAPGALLNCGTVLAPTPGAGLACAPAHRDLTVVGGIAGALGLAAIVGGGVLRAMSPRPLSF